MDRQTLEGRRNRTHAIVEGALLADIMLVFLLMRVYLPVPIVRTLLRTAASVPLVVLMQRRGLKITLLATVAGFILFSSLVGPLLALTALDVALAGILIGLGRKAGLGVGLNTLWTGPVFAVLDLIVPTVAAVFLFRYPVKDLVQSARHFVSLLFTVLLDILHLLRAPADVLHTVRVWERPVVADWELVWIGIMVVYGLLNMYLVALVSDMVLTQIPEGTLEEQVA